MTTWPQFLGLIESHAELMRMYYRAEHESKLATNLLKARRVILDTMETEYREIVFHPVGNETDYARLRREATLSKAFVLSEVCNPGWKQRALALFGDRDEIRVNEVIGAMRGVPLLDYREMAEWLKENGLIEIGKKTERYHPTGKSV